MRKSTKRPPDQGGGGEVVAEAQRELPLGVGGSARTGFPRVFRHHAEDTQRCSFTVGGARYGGPTPYADGDMALAFARGALAVAEAIHADGGRSVLVCALGGRTATLRWQTKAAPRRNRGTTLTPLRYAHVGIGDVTARIAALARLGEAEARLPHDHDED
ncbi:hypothetical protein [Methylobacterium sp. J-076]|uniref:hypothetical protein n=1 Tax=Methylobacterium sp. J-076 TaxID=2836655 RepID=UPI001FBA4327|nr:hypothetical protein [Methylobacterium sp. J-076]MCJ2014199.1 hypothetical protein [Methylobacterium sp. J-076]